MQQQDNALTPRQQEEIKQMIECALLGFKASITHELSLLTQLFQTPLPEKAPLLQESPIRVVADTSESKELPSSSTKAPQQSAKSVVVPVEENKQPEEAKPVEVEKKEVPQQEVKTQQPSEKKKVLKQPRWEYGNKKAVTTNTNKIKAKVAYKIQKKSPPAKENSVQPPAETAVGTMQAPIEIVEDKATPSDKLTTSINATEIVPEKVEAKSKIGSPKKVDRPMNKRMPLKPHGQVKPIIQKRPMVQH